VVDPTGIKISIGCNDIDLIKPGVTLRRFFTPFDVEQAQADVRVPGETTWSLIA